MHYLGKTLEGKLVLYTTESESEKFIVIQGGERKTFATVNDVAEEIVDQEMVYLRIKRIKEIYQITKMIEGGKVSPEAKVFGKEFRELIQFEVDRQMTYEKAFSEVAAETIEKFLNTPLREDRKYFVSYTDFDDPRGFSSVEVGEVRTIRDIGRKWLEYCVKNDLHPNLCTGFEAREEAPKLCEKNEENIRDR